MNYYTLLGVARDASDAELKKAFWMMSLKCLHQDKFSADTGVAAELQTIREAYEVLTDPERRNLYDQECLKTGCGGIPGGGKDSGAQWIADCFAKVLGAKPKEYLSSCIGGRVPGGMKDGFSGMADATYDSTSERSKDPPIEHTLFCTLEELFNGTTRTLKFSREVLDASTMNTMNVDETLEINIKPGWKRGEKVFFTEKGFERPGVIPADVIFVIDEKPHRRFRREGNDLLYTARVPRVEALGGTAVSVLTLDARWLKIAVPHPISSTMEEVVSGEGMPIFEEGPGSHGDLRIEFYFD